MIVSGIITNVEKKEGKIHYIEVRLSRVLAVCFGGPHLIDNPERYYIDSNIKNGLNYTYLESLNFFFQNLYKQSIIGYIRSSDVKLNFNIKTTIIIILTF